MKSGVFVFLFVLCITLASAADVSYVYRSEGKIDDNVLGVFDEMGLSYELVHEKDASGLEGFIFVGDEKFRKDVPIGNGGIVMSYFNGAEWGLTDNDGISQIGSTKPLKVDKGDEVVVYDRAFMMNRIAVPYYYLDKMNKLEDGTQVAACMKSSSGENYGDVISYFDSGTELMNGEVTGGNICFFGIIKSDYWTTEAREMFKECVLFSLGGQADAPEPQPIQDCQTNLDCGETEISELFCQEGWVYHTETRQVCVFDEGDNSACEERSVDVAVEVCEFGCEEAMCLEEIEVPEGPVIACFSDSDCPDEEMSALYCAEGTEIYDNNVYQMVTSYSCINPGMEDSACVSTDEEILIEDCEFDCEGGACVGEIGIPESDMHDVGFINFSTSVNMVKIEDSGGVDILEGESLMCNEKYKIKVKLENKGDFIEDVSFLGDVGGIMVNHNSISEMQVGDKKEKTKTINMTLAGGSHTLSIEALIDGFTDANAGDNLISREIFVECGGD